MDSTTITAISTIGGAVAMTIIPYLMKVWQSPDIKFNLNYFYSLLIGLVVQIGALLPDDVSTVTIKSLIVAFGSGAGIQALLNKAVPKPKEIEE